MTCLTCLDCIDIDYILSPYDFFNLNYFTIVTCAEDRGGRGRTRRKKNLRFLKLTQLIIENMLRNPSPLPKQKYMYFSPPPLPQGKKELEIAQIIIISVSLLPLQILHSFGVSCQHAVLMSTETKPKLLEPPKSNFHIRKALAGVKKG